MLLLNGNMCFYYEARNEMQVCLQTITKDKHHKFEENLMYFHYKQIIRQKLFTYNIYIIISLILKVHNFQQL